MYSYHTLTFTKNNSIALQKAVKNQRSFKMQQDFMQRSRQISLRYRTIILQIVCKENNKIKPYQCFKNFKHYVHHDELFNLKLNIIKVL